MSGKLLYEAIKDAYLFHSIWSVMLHSKHKRLLTDLLHFFSVCLLRGDALVQTAGPQSKLEKREIYMFCKNILNNTLISKKGNEVTLSPLLETLGRASVCF